MDYKNQENIIYYSIYIKLKELVTLVYSKKKMHHSGYLWEVLIRKHNKGVLWADIILLSSY